jgi:hypothetical protein
MTEIKVVGLGGSLAERSASRVALNIALKGAEEAGAPALLGDSRYARAGRPLHRTAYPRLEL